MLRLISMIKLPEGPDTPDYPSTPNTGPLLDHLVKFLSSCARWLAREIGGAGHALFGILEVAVDAVGRVLTAVRKSAQGALSHVTIEARLDADTFALRQIVITPLRRDGSVLAPDLPVDFAGFHLSLPNDARPSLVIDLTGSAAVVAFVVAPSGSMTLSTALWLDRGSGAKAASAKADNPGPGKNQLPLVAITVTPTRPIALIALSSGHPRFFQELVVDGPLDETEVVNGNTYRVMLLRGRPRFRSLNVAGAFKVDLNIEAAKRLLPFLSAPKKEAAAGGSLFDGLSQYVAVKQSAPVRVDGGVAKLAVEVAIHIGGDDVDATLQLDLDLETLEVKIEGGKQIFIEGTEEARDFLGLKLKIELNPPVHAPFRQFVLDFSGGDARLALAPGVTAQLAYTRIASRGAGWCSRSASSRSPARASISTPRWIPASLFSSPASICRFASRAAAFRPARRTVGFRDTGLGTIAARSGWRGQRQHLHRDGARRRRPAGGSVGGRGTGKGRRAAGLQVDPLHALHLQARPLVPGFRRRRGAFLFPVDRERALHAGQRRVLFRSSQIFPRLDDHFGEGSSGRRRPAAAAPHLSPGGGQSAAPHKTVRAVRVRVARRRLLSLQRPFRRQGGAFGFRADVLP